MSIHVEKSKQLARSKGAAAGDEGNAPLWDLSKRELVEMVLHLAALCTGESIDSAIDSAGAYTRAMEEHRALVANGLL